MYDVLVSILVDDTVQAFFEDNPRFQKNPFYVFGESYGGRKSLGSFPTESQRC